MKTARKLIALLMALSMIMALAITANAQEASPNPKDTDNASITVSNASKGETYAAYKLFDATVTGTKDGSIAYQATAIPEGLGDYFEVDAKGNVLVKMPRLRMTK